MSSSAMSSWANLLRAKHSQADGEWKVAIWDLNSTSVKWLAGAVGVLAVIWLYVQFGDRLSLSYLASQELRLTRLKDDYPVTVVLAAIVFYALVTGVNVPGATVLTLAYAWYFKFWVGLVVVSFGSTGGALLAFLLSRYLLREWFQQKFQQRLGPINAALEREGALYLFTLRLTPVIPFFVINPVMGLTKISAFTFWWVSQVGMLPATIAYVNAGASVPSLQTLATEGVGPVLSWELLVAFAILGILPLTLKRIVAFWR
jgi:uncharacterized membrane protein YdjX (TVP38/TMEM64 family)